MTKLHQILPLEASAKNKAHQVLGQVHHLLERTPLLNGHSRVYTPKNEDGDQLPPESQLVQVRGTEQLTLVQQVMNRLFDLTLTKEVANQQAVADIVVGDVTILAEVPVTYLLFLEKSLTDLRTFFRKLPLLDPSVVWTWDETTSTWRSDVQETTRQKKVPKAFVKYQATKEHPAQVDVFTEDVLEGTWALTRFSGAFQKGQVDEFVEKIEALLDAVKVARSKANEVEAVKQDASALLDYLLS